jgi:hypothetical protein
VTWGVLVMRMFGGLAIKMIGVLSMVLIEEVRKIFYKLCSFIKIL